MRNLEMAIDWYRRSFGAEVEHRETIEHDGVEEALIRVAESYIQLLSPVTKDSPVSRYLTKHGEGIHHIAYRVSNCALVLDELRAAGISLVDEVPRPGSRNTTVAFIQPVFGHLVELVEE